MYKSENNFEKALDEIIGSGNKYFNTLNFKRDAITFIENKKGSATRYGNVGKGFAGERFFSEK